MPFPKRTFGIKTKNLTHLIGLIRNDIYSDKILAVIREYACNAYDANVERGKGNVPIQISLPTLIEPNFKVRDFGKGLSKDEIEDIFISYGESTKRESNAFTGQLGIGSKSGFCYGTNFLVTSFNGGIKTTYDCVLDKLNVGECLELLSVPMKSTDQEGIEISIPVRIEDIERFKLKSFKFFKSWEVHPDIEGYSQDEIKAFYQKDEILFQGQGWKIYQNEYNSTGHVSNTPESQAVMGNIPYPLNWNTVNLASNSGTTKLMDYLKNSRLVMYFNIGELQFAPSREQLQYTDITNKAIDSKLAIILGEIEKVVIDKFSNCKNLHEAKILYSELFEGGFYAKNLSSLASYFKGRLTWNGIQIDSNHFTGFKDIDFLHGYTIPTVDPTKKDQDEEEEIKKKDVLTTYTYSYKVKKIKKNANNTITCNKLSKILLIDVYKNAKVKSAVSIVCRDASIKTIYVLQFGSSQVKDEVFAKLSLDSVPMTKYSSISGEIKSIPRKPKVLSATPTIVYKRCKSMMVSEVTSIGTYCRAKEILKSDSVDMDAGGYYFDLRGQMINRSLTDNILRKAASLNDFSEHQFTKIHGFTDNILNHKNFNKNKNWFEIERLLLDKLTKVATEEHFKWYMAYENIRTGKLPKNICTKIGSEPAFGPGHILKEYADIVNKIQLSSSNTCDLFNSGMYSGIYRPDIKLQVQKLTDLFRAIQKEYPLIMIVLGHEPSFINECVTYSLMIDKANKNV